MLRIDGQITLEELSLSDTDLYYELMNRIEVKEFFPYGFEDKKIMQGVIEWLILNYDMEKPYRLTYKIVIDNKIMIGIVSYGLLQSDNTKREIAYILSPEFWGMGYATKTVKSFLEYIFCEYNEDVMYTEIESRNEKSIRVIERCGFTQIGMFIDKDTRRQKYLYKINKK